MEVKHRIQVFNNPEWIKYEQIILYYLSNEIKNKGKAKFSSGQGVFLNIFSTLQTNLLVRFQFR